MPETSGRCAADETVIVGDTTFDIEMGVRAGCRAIGVAYGNHPSAELYEAGAEHVMHHIGELTGFLAPLPAR